MKDVLTGVHIITEEEAKDLISRWDGEIKYECFDLNELLASLSNPEMTRLRIHYGKTPEGETRLVLVGVNDEGKWIDSPMENQKQIIETLKEQVEYYKGKCGE